MSESRGWCTGGVGRREVERARMVGNEEVWRCFSVDMMPGV